MFEKSVIKKTIIFVIIVIINMIFIVAAAVSIFQSTERVLHNESRQINEDDEMENVQDDY